MTGFTPICAFNYNMLQKKKIGIEDFFYSPQETLKKISQISAQDIMSQLQSRGWKTDDSLKEMLSQGTAPVFENFSNFNFDTHNLVIYFQRYQVAPGAACQVECVNYRVHYSSQVKGIMDKRHAK